MNLINLKYFFDAVELESVSQAATRNFVTQSAVSQGIQKLEKALGLTLMTHQRNCFKLTHEGRVVFNEAQNVFRSIKLISDKARELENIVSGEINITCTQSIAINLIAYLLPAFKAKYPHVIVRMKISKMENIIPMLQRGVMDLGIVVESEGCDSFQTHLVAQGNFYVYHNKGIQNALEEGVYVDHVSGLNVKKLEENFYKNFKRKLFILQEMDSWQVLAQCAENGIGACFLPEFVVGKNSSLIKYKKLPPIPYRIVAIHPKGVHFSKALNAFLEFIIQKK